MVMTEKEYVKNVNLIGDTSIKAVDYKFNELQYLNELRDYIDKTYDQHYSKTKFQASEFIFDAGHGTGFNIGNVLKYAQRYGRKGTRADSRRDLMKVLHYTMMQIHVHDELDKEGLSE